jgi:hypothetical protein
VRHVRKKAQIDDWNKFITMTLPVEKDSGWRHGFIYVCVRAIMDFLRWFSLVEYFKWVASVLAKEPDTEKCRTHVSQAVDLYTLLKWAVVLLLWGFWVQNGFTRALVWYLLIANLHTFTYYFLFKREPPFDPDRSRKRFIKLGIAILFSHCCFAYLYSCCYAGDFMWPADTGRRLAAFWFSVSNSVGGTYDAVKRNNGIAYGVSMIQYMISFVFVAVLVTKAMPADKA